MKSPRDILGLWPSIPKLAEDIGRPAVTVYQWQNRGSIPVAAFADLIASAKRFKIEGVDAETLVLVHTPDNTLPASNVAV